MKRQFLLTRMLLLFALIVGSGSGWAEETVTWNINGVNTTAPGGTNVNTTLRTSSILPNTETGVWTAVASSSYAGSNSGAQFGSSSYTFAGTITLSGTKIPSTATIKSIGITLSSSGTAYKINATVGGDSFGSQVSVNQKASKTYTFSGSIVGNNIVLTFSSGGTKNVIITAISVTYSASTEPSIDADNVNIAYNATSGEFGYTLTNPVDGGELSATDDVDWISDVVVNTGTNKVTFNTTANSNPTPREGTITMTYKKGDETLATKEVTISQAEAVVLLNYTKATQVVPGRHYIITSGINGSIKAMGADRGNNHGSVELTASENKTSFYSNEGVCELIIGGDMETGYYTLYDVGVEKYISAASSSGNNMKYVTTLDGDAKWTIDIDGTGKAVIQSQGTYSRNTIRHNSGNNPPLFSCYDSDKQSDIYLFERDGDTSVQNVDVTIYAACHDGKGNYYGTYSNPFAFTVPADLIVSEIGINNEGKLNVKPYATNAVVPAGTGVMVSSTTDGAHPVTLAVGGTSVLGASNCLYGTGSGLANATAMSSVISGCNYYRLTMHNGDKIGFWWGAENGEAFAYNTANRAFLAVPTSSTSRSGFNLFDDETTGIETVDVNTESANDAREYYNLNGQRVANPSKGLYIVNGKKVIIK